MYNHVSTRGQCVEPQGYIPSQELCESDADCADGNDCTIDTCEDDGTCTFVDVCPSESPSSVPSSVPSMTMAPSSAPSLVPSSAPTTSTAPSSTPTNNPTATPCSDGKKRLEVDVLTDNYPYETSWNLIDTCDGTVIFQEGPYSAQATLHTKSECVDPGKFLFTMTDSWGDGICCGFGLGSYEIKWDNDLVMAGGEFGSEIVHEFGSCSSQPPTPAPPPPPPPPPVTASPTISPVANETDVPSLAPSEAPSPDASSSSPSQLASAAPSALPSAEVTSVPSATLSSSPSQLASASPSLLESTTPSAVPSTAPSALLSAEPSAAPVTSAPTPIQPGCTDMTFTIHTDRYPRETTWDLKDGEGNAVESGGPYSQRNRVFAETKCLEYIEHTFTIKDSFGDGMCCRHGQGSWTITYTDSDFVVATGADFNQGETVTFTPGAPNVGQFELSLLTDKYPRETTWNVVSASTGRVVLFGGPYDKRQTSYTVSESLHAEDCYKIFIYDAWGDGICCSYGRGSAEMKWDGNSVGTAAKFDREWASDAFGDEAVCASTAGSIVAPPAAAQGTEANTSDGRSAQ